MHPIIIMKLHLSDKLFPCFHKEKTILSDALIDLPQCASIMPMLLRSSYQMLEIY